MARVLKQCQAELPVLLHIVSTKVKVPVNVMHVDLLTSYQIFCCKPPLYAQAVDRSVKVTGEDQKLVKDVKQ